MVEGPISKKKKQLFNPARLDLGGDFSGLVGPQAPLDFGALPEMGFIPPQEGSPFAPPPEETFAPPAPPPAPAFQPSAPPTFVEEPIPPAMGFTDSRGGSPFARPAREVFERPVFAPTDMPHITGDERERQRSVKVALDEEAERLADLYIESIRQDVSALHRSKQNFADYHDKYNFVISPALNVLNRPGVSPTMGAYGPMFRAKMGTFTLADLHDAERVPKEELAYAASLFKLEGMFPSEDDMFDRIIARKGVLEGWKAYYKVIPPVHISQKTVPLKMTPVNLEASLAKGGEDWSGWTKGYTEAINAARAEKQALFERFPERKEEYLRTLYIRIKDRVEELRQPFEHPHKETAFVIARQRGEELTELQPAFRMLSLAFARKEDAKKRQLERFNAGRSEPEMKVSPSIRALGIDLQSIRDEILMREMPEDEALSGVAVTREGKTWKPEEVQLSDRIVARLREEGVVKTEEGPVTMADLNSDQIEEALRIATKEQLKETHEEWLSVEKDENGREMLAFPVQRLDVEEFAFYATDTVPPMRWMAALVASAYVGDEEKQISSTTMVRELYKTLHTTDDPVEAGSVIASIRGIIKDATTFKKAVITGGVERDVPQRFYKDRLMSIFAHFVPRPISWFKDNDEPWMYDDGKTLIPIYPVSDHEYKKLLEAFMEGKPKPFRLISSISSTDFMIKRKEEIDKNIFVPSNLQGTEAEYKLFSEMMGRRDVPATFKWLALKAQGRTGVPGHYTVTQAAQWLGNEDFDLSNVPLMQASALNEMVRQMKTGHQPSILKSFFESAGDAGAVFTSAIYELAKGTTLWTAGTAETLLKLPTSYGIGFGASMIDHQIAQEMSQYSLSAAAEATAELKGELTTALDNTTHFVVGTIDYLGDYTDPATAGRRLLYDFPFAFADGMMAWSLATGALKVTAWGVSAPFKGARALHVRIGKNLREPKYSNDTRRVIKYAQDNFPELRPKVENRLAEWDRQRKYGTEGFYNSIIEVTDKPYSWLSKRRPSPLIEGVRDYIAEIAKRPTPMGRLASRFIVPGNFGDGTIRIMIEDLGASQVKYQILAAEAVEQAVNTYVKEHGGSPEHVAQIRRDFTEILSVAAESDGFANQVLFDYSFTPAGTRPRYTVNSSVRDFEGMKKIVYEVKDVVTGKVVKETISYNEAKAAIAKGEALDRTNTVVNQLDEVLPNGLPEDINIERIKGPRKEGVQLVDKETGERVFVSTDPKEVAMELRRLGEEFVSVVPEELSRMDPDFAPTVEAGGKQWTEKRYRRILAEGAETPDIHRVLNPKTGEIFGEFPTIEEAYGRLRELGYESPVRFLTTAEELARVFSSEEFVAIVEQVYTLNAKRANPKLARDPLNPHLGVHGLTVPIVDIVGNVHSLDAVRLGLLRQRGKTFELTPKAKELVKHKRFGDAALEYKQRPPINAMEEIALIDDLFETDPNGVRIIDPFAVQETEVRATTKKPPSKVAEKPTPEQPELDLGLEPKKTLTAEESVGTQARVSVFDFLDILRRSKTEDVYTKLLEVQAKAVTDGLKIKKRTPEGVLAVYEESSGIRMKIGEPLTAAEIIEEGVLVKIVRPKHPRHKWQIRIPSKKALRKLKKGSEKKPVPEKPVAAKEKHIWEMTLEEVIEHNEAREYGHYGKVGQTREQWDKARSSPRAIREKRVDAKEQQKKYVGSVLKSLEKKTGTAFEEGYSVPEHVVDFYPELAAKYPNAAKAAPPEVVFEPLLPASKNLGVVLTRQAVENVLELASNPGTKIAKDTIGYSVENGKMYPNINPKLHSRGLVRDAMKYDELKAATLEGSRRIKEEAFHPQTAPKHPSEHSRTAARSDAKRPDSLLTLAEYLKRHPGKEISDYAKVVQAAIDKGFYRKVLALNEIGKAIADREIVYQIISSAGLEVPANLKKIIYGLEKSGGVIDYRVDFLKFTQTLTPEEAAALGLGKVKLIPDRTGVPYKELAREFGLEPKKGVVLFEYMSDEVGKMVERPASVVETISKILEEDVTLVPKKPFVNETHPWLERNNPDKIGLVMLEDSKGNVITRDRWNIALEKNKSMLKDMNLEEVELYRREVDFIDAKEHPLGKMYHDVGQAEMKPMLDKVQQDFLNTAGETSWGSAWEAFKKVAGMKYKEFYKNPIVPVKKAFNQLSGEELIMWDNWRRGTGEMPPIAEIYGAGENWVKAGLAEPVLDAAGKTISYKPTPLGVMAAFYSIGRRNSFVKNIPFYALTGDAARGIAPQLRLDFRRILDELPVATREQRSRKAALEIMNDLDNGHAWLSDPIIGYQREILAYAGDTGMFPTDSAILNMVEYMRNIWEGSFNEYGRVVSGKQAVGVSQLREKSTAGYTEAEIAAVEQVVGNFRVHLDPEMFRGWVTAELRSHIDFSNLIEKLVDEGLIHPARKQPYFTVKTEEGIKLKRGLEEPPGPPGLEVLDLSHFFEGGVFRAKSKVEVYVRELADVPLKQVPKTIRKLVKEARKKQESLKETLEAAKEEVRADGKKEGLTPGEIDAHVEAIEQRAGLKYDNPVIKGLHEKYGTLYGTDQVREILNLHVANIDKWQAITHKYAHNTNPLNHMFFDEHQNLLPREVVFEHAAEIFGDEIRVKYIEAYEEVAGKGSAKGTPMENIIKAIKDIPDLFTAVIDLTAKASEMVNNNPVQQWYKKNALFRSTIRGAARNLVGNGALAIAHHVSNHPEIFFDEVYWEGAKHFWSDGMAVVYEGPGGLVGGRRFEPVRALDVGYGRAPKPVRKQVAGVDVEYRTEAPLPPDVQEFAIEMISRQVFGNGPAAELRQEVAALMSNFYRNPRTRVFNRQMQEVMTVLRDEVSARVKGLYEGAKFAEGEVPFTPEAAAKRAGQTAEFFAAKMQQDFVAAFVDNLMKQKFFRKMFMDAVNEHGISGFAKWSRDWMLDFPFNTGAGKSLEHMVKALFVVTDDMYRWNYAYWLWKRKKLPYNEIVRKVGDFMPDFIRNSPAMHSVRLANPWAFWPVKTLNNMLLLAWKRPLMSGFLRHLGTWLDALEQTEMSPEEQWSFLLRPNRERAGLFRTAMGDYSWGYSFYTGDMDTFLDPVAAAGVGMTGMAWDALRILAEPEGGRFKPRFGPSQVVGNGFEKILFAYHHFLKTYGPRLGISLPGMVANVGYEYLNKYGRDLNVKMWESEDKAARGRRFLRRTVGAMTKTGGNVLQKFHRMAGEAVDPDQFAALAQDKFFWVKNQGTKDPLTWADLIMSELGGFDAASRSRLRIALVEVIKAEGGAREAVSLLSTDPMKEQFLPSGRIAEIGVEKLKQTREPFTYSTRAGMALEKAPRAAAMKEMRGYEKAPFAEPDQKEYSDEVQAMLNFLRAQEIDKGE